MRLHGEEWLEAGCGGACFHLSSQMLRTSGTAVDAQPSSHRELRASLSYLRSVFSQEKKNKHRLKVDSEHNCLNAEMVSIVKNIEYSLAIQHNEIK